MSEKWTGLKLSDFHPFTKRQAETINLVAEGKNNREIAQSLNIQPETVKNLLYGHPGTKDQVSKHMLHSSNLSPSSVGVFGEVEKITGERPKSRTDLIRRLIDDVLFFYK